MFIYKDIRYKHLQTLYSSEFLRIEFKKCITHFFQKKWNTKNWSFYANVVYVVCGFPYKEDINLTSARRYDRLIPHTSYFIRLKRKVEKNYYHVCIEYICLSFSLTSDRGNKCIQILQNTLLLHSYVTSTYTFHLICIFF